MTDRTNPITTATPTGKYKGPVTVGQLHELAARLNRSAFVIANGWHYFVSQRLIEEKWRAVLDRSDRA